MIVSSAPWFRSPEFVIEGNAADQQAARHFCRYAAAPLQHIAAVFAAPGVEPAPRSRQEPRSIFAGEAR